MDMDKMTGRAEQLISAIANSIMSATEAAAERVALASEVAKVQTRMSAFGAVLNSIGAQKAALEDRRKAAKGPLKALLGRQIEALSIQETGILERAGVAPEAALAAVKTADEAPRLYARNGRNSRR